MKAKHTFLIALIIMFSITIQITANQSGIAGRNNSPSETNCTSCHNSYTLGSGSGSMIITHNIPVGGYTPSTTYTITVTITQAAMPVFGFGFEALNTSNTSAGTLIVTNSTTTKLLTASNGRSNITHKTNGGLTTGSHAFTFNWTSPSSNIGNITFYAGGVAGNNNGNEFSDYVYVTSMLITPYAPSNSIATSTISGSPFCAGQTGISIPYSIVGTFNAGNVFTAQLSDSLGAFTTPTTIGTVSSTTAGTITSNIALPSIAGTNYRIRVVANNPATIGTDNGSNLTINIPVTANAGTDQSVCSLSAVFTGNTPSSGNGIWTLFSGAGTITTSSSPTSAVTSLGAGANSFIWTITNGGCVTRDTVIINSVSNSTASNAGTDQNICSNIATLAGNTPTSGIGLWSQISGTGTITDSSNRSTTVTSLGIGVNTFVWKISNPPCATSFDTVVVTRSNAPTQSNAGSDQSICSSISALAANSPIIGTGTWSLISGAGNITSPGSSTSGLTALGVGDNIFVWAITNGTCSSNDTVIVSRKIPPTIANAGIDQTVCANSVTLAGNVATTGSGKWTQITGTGTIINDTNAGTVVNTISSGISKFVWTISNSPCAASRDTVVITQSGSLTTAVAGPDQTLCSSSTTLAGNTPVTGTGQWSLVSGTATITTPSNPASTITGMGNGNIVLRWTISNAGCTPSTSDVTIHNCTIQNTITTGVISGSPFCANTSYSVAIPFTTTGTFTGYFIAELSDSSGSFTIPVSIGAGAQSPIYAVIPSTTFSGNHYRIRIKNTTPFVAGTDNGVNVSINNCITNTITTGTILGSPFCANTSYSVAVPFTTTGTFTGYFVAELSDSSGSFSTSTVIGSGSVSPISAFIPSSSTSGMKYRIRVRNTNPNISVPDNGVNLFINTCVSNTITTGTISGSPFCNATSYYVTIPFMSTGNFNGYYTAELSDSIGNFSIPTIIGSGTSNPIYGVIPSSTLRGTKYRIRIRNSNPNFVGTNNGVDLSINSCISNTITTGLISGSPFCENTSYMVSVAFTSTGTFNGYFTAQLSDANGSFSNPVPIGIGGTSPINAVIPSNTISGTLYKIRVVNNNPVIVGSDNGSFLEINDCNVLIIDSIKGNPFCTSTSYNVNVQFKIIGTSAGPFVAELSNASGSFATPLSIGYGYNSPISGSIPSKIITGYNYRIRVRDAGSGYFTPACSNNLLINSCANVGVADLNMEDFIHIYPNPNAGKFEIAFLSELHAPVSVSIFNLVGEEIKRIDVANINANDKISIDNLALGNGVYILKIISSEMILTKKILINY